MGLNLLLFPFMFTLLKPLAGKSLEHKTNYHIDLSIFWHCIQPIHSNWLSRWVLHPFNRDGLLSITESWNPSRVACFQGQLPSYLFLTTPPQTEFWDRAGLVITSRGPGSRGSRHEGFGYQVDSTSCYIAGPISCFVSPFDLHLCNLFSHDK